VLVENKEIVINGNVIKIAKVKDEWYTDVENPEKVIRALINSGLRADIFSFWQRFPNVEVKYSYYYEWEKLSILPIKSYKQWWEKQIHKSARNHVRQASKKGVSVEVVKFTDDLVRGIASIYNETKIRQGKIFPHYGDDLDKVRRENSTYLDKSIFLAAYCNEELIGFIRLILEEQFADIIQILSKIEHRDKAPTNALIAKAVEVCEKRGIPYLAYGEWGKGGLKEFKIYNGFELRQVPRYYVPLNFRGRIALKCQLHKGLIGMLPEKLIFFLLELRGRYYERAERKEEKQDLDPGFKVRKNA